MISQKALKYAAIFVKGDVVGPDKLLLVAQNLDAIFEMEGISVDDGVEYGSYWAAMSVAVTDEKEGSAAT